MSERIEFGNKAAADSFREEHEEHVCPIDDDKRLKTVALVSDVPEYIVEQAEVEAAAGRAERADGPGQIELTKQEKKALGPFTGSNNYRKAAAVKGVMRAAGVDDWTSHYDSSLTVDEHHEIATRAAREDQGKRLDAEKTVDEQLGAAEKAVGQQCDHAQDHCEHGDPAACEFLREGCGYSEHEVSLILKPDTDAQEYEQQQLVTVGGGDFPEMDVTPQVAGALHRSWQGYKAGIGHLDRLLAEVREAVINARQSMAAINEIRGEHEQEELHPDRLHDLLNALARMPQSIPEVRTLDHFAESSTSATSSMATDPVDPSTVIEADDQRTFGGGRANPQATLAGGEEGERGQGEVEQAATVEQNEGGLMGDTREQTPDNSGENTEQATPDAFQVADGGQDTL